MRVTLSDIAREAGVSPATVDRALNGRGGVRRRTREVVVEVARRMGYIASEETPVLAESGGRLRLDFVLPEGTNPFMRTLRDEIARQGAARPDLEVRVTEIEGFNPDRLAATLAGLGAPTRGVGVVALDHPTVREAIRSLDARGVRVVTLVSDILHVPREAYVGIDNRQAGRLAGFLLGRFLAGRPGGKVAMFAGSRSYRGHEEREAGFRDVLAEAFPGLEIVALREMHDDRVRAHAEALGLLAGHPDLVGIYNIGAGTEGIARALKERGLAGRIVFVGHDATAANRALLLDGTMDAAIDQNPLVEAREALNILARSIRGEAGEPHLPRLQVVFRENIPEI